MKREQFARAVRKWARKRGVSVSVDSRLGKGSHYLMTVGDRSTTLKSGDYTPGYVRLLCKQLNIPPDAL